MKFNTVILSLIVSVFFSMPANSALLDRGTGMIYDTELGITWLHDANYAMTSGYASNGHMNWNQAITWAAGLNINGITGWRLPNAVDGTASGNEYEGTTFSGYNITTSEMGHLFYTTLGNKGYLDVNGGYQSDYGLTNNGPFINLTPDTYWSGTEYSLNTNFAWEFYFGSGAQGEGGKESGLHAMAVRDGDFGPSVSTDQTYLTDFITLGDSFSFDYYWEMGTEPTNGNFDVLFFNGTEWETLGWQLNLGGSSVDWASASFYVPTWARGENVQIMFSLKDWGTETDPTVYLRNIASNGTAPVPEPATILLVGTGLAGLAGVRFRIKKKLS